jgi:hypothetical protein
LPLLFPVPPVVVLALADGCGGDFGRVSESERTSAFTSAVPRSLGTEAKKTAGGRLLPRSMTTTAASSLVNDRPALAAP